MAGMPTLANAPLPPLDSIREKGVMVLTIANLSSRYHVARMLAAELLSASVDEEVVAVLIVLNALVTTCSTTQLETTES
jgi:hypothetical protein